MQSKRRKVNTEAINIGHIPDDVLKEQILYLNPESMQQVNLVSKKWHLLFGKPNEHVWHVRLSELLGVNVAKVDRFVKYIKTYFPAIEISPLLLKKMIFNLKNLEKNIFFMPMHVQVQLRSTVFRPLLLACATNIPEVALAIIPTEKYLDYFHIALGAGCDLVAVALQQAKPEIDQSDWYIKSQARRLGDVSMAIRIGAFENASKPMLLEAISASRVDVVQYLLKHLRLDKNGWDTASNIIFPRMLHFLNDVNYLRKREKLKWTREIANAGNHHAIIYLLNQGEEVDFNYNKLAFLKYLISTFQYSSSYEKYIHHLKAQELAELALCAAECGEKSILILILGLNPYPGGEIPQALLKAGAQSSVDIVKYIISLGLKPNRDTLEGAIGSDAVIDYLLDEKNQFGLKVDGDLLNLFITRQMAAKIIQYSKVIEFAEDVDHYLVGAKNADIAMYVFLNKKLSYETIEVPDFVSEDDHEFTTLLNTENMIRQSLASTFHADIYEFMRSMEHLLNESRVHVVNVLADILLNKNRYHMTDVNYLDYINHPLLVNLYDPRISLKLFEFAQEGRIQLSVEDQCQMLETTKRKAELFEENRDIINEIDDAISRIRPFSVYQFN